MGESTSPKHIDIDVVEIWLNTDGQYDKFIVQRTSKLGDVQQTLCDMFQMASPMMAAILTNAQQEQFAEFTEA